MKKGINYHLKNSSKWDQKRKVCFEWLQNILNEYMKNRNIEISLFANGLLKNKKYSKFKKELIELIPNIQNLISQNEKFKMFDRLEVQSNKGKLSIHTVTSITLIENTNEDKLNNLEHLLRLSKFIENEKYLNMPEFKKLKVFLLRNPGSIELLKNIFCDYEIAVKTQENKTLEIFNDFKTIYNNLTTKQKEIIRNKNKYKERFNKYFDLFDKSEREKTNIQKQRGTINQYFTEWESQTISMGRVKKNFYENEFIKKYPELKSYPFIKFSNNFRKDKSIREKAINKNN